MYYLCTEDLSKLHMNSNINKLTFLIVLIRMLLTLYTVPLMKIFLRPGFASAMRGAVGSNTTSCEGPVTLCFVIVCGREDGFSQSHEHLSRGWNSQYKHVNRTGM